MGELVAAATHDGGAYYLYADGRLVGVSAGGYVEVLKGLSEGQTVLVRP